MARKIILTLQPKLLAACLGLLVAARGVEAKYVVRTLEANLRVRLAPSLPRARAHFTRDRRSSRRRSQLGLDRCACAR